MCSSVSSRRAAEFVEEFVDLIFGDHERGTESHRIAETAHDKPVIEGALHAVGADREARVVRLLGLLVGDEFDRAHQPLAARLSDHRVCSELGQPRLERLAHLGRMGE